MPVKQWCCIFKIWFNKFYIRIIFCNLFFYQRNITVNFFGNIFGCSDCNSCIFEIFKYLSDIYLGITKIRMIFLRILNVSTGLSAILFFCIYINIWIGACSKRLGIIRYVCGFLFLSILESFTFGIRICTFFTLSISRSSLFVLFTFNIASCVLIYIRSLIYVIKTQSH